MSTLISSFIIDPVVRQARRFSGATHGVEDTGLSHANSSSLSTPSSEATTPERHVDAANSARDEDIPPTTDAISSPMISRLREISRSQSAVVDDVDDNNDVHNPPLSVPQSLSTPPIDIPLDAGMSSSSGRTLETQLARLDLDPPLAAISTDTSTQSSNESGATAQHAAISELLPADDGFGHLRVRIHQIRDMSIADEEKARMVHSLMTARYNFLRPQSPSSFTSNDRPFTPTSGQSIFSDVNISSPISTASEIDPENPYNLRPGDTEPTYRIRSNNYQILDPNGEDEDFDTAEDGSSLGCQHYKRNVKVQCHQCRRWHTCRHCHDDVEDHNLNRRKTVNMMCMVCRTPQSAAERCAQCGTVAAWYYCDICKLWDDNSSKKIYHCLDCGICRKGEGLGKDYIHCKRCNVCISIGHVHTHKCLERATDCDCPICGEYLFNSSSAVVSMPCGHYLHKGCYKLYMETAYKCPMCKKSAVNMELQWRKLTQAIESQPMPEHFTDTRAVIQCNDCSTKSSVKYHWLGNKCNTCDSYNTNEIRILNGPESEQVANAMLSVDENAGARSPASVLGASSPSSQPLRSPRYYFQPDQPEETWLPNQLPSFGFHMPQMPQFPVQFPVQFPGMPQMPQMPQIPQFPGMPQLPNLPQMPQMPDASELMERVSRSFAPFRNYLNPTGEIADESVPIIDLGDEHVEVKLTDGSTIPQPSLPQYVLERFSRSVAPLRNYLNPSTDNIPPLDLSQGQDADGVPFWKEGGRMNRFLSGAGGHDEEGSSSEESADEEDDDEEEEEEGDGEGDDKDFELPGHR